MNIGEYRLPFGEYKGKTLVTVASTVEGIQYLDRLRIARERNNARREALDMILAKFIKQAKYQDVLCGLLGVQDAKYKHRHGDGEDYDHDARDCPAN